MFIQLINPLQNTKTMYSKKALFFSLLIVSSFFFFDVYAQHIEEPVKSHILLQTTTSWNGGEIKYPEGDAQITALSIEIAPGASTGWHHHPVPSFAYILQGAMEVSLEDGRTIQLTAGDALAEVINTIHEGRNIGDEPVKLIVFYTGVTDKELTVKAENGD